jgi:nucleotide-binding universal stress UspA family protein
LRAFKTLLVTTDLSEPSFAAVRQARTLAEKLDAKVVLCYVVEDRLVPLVDAASFERIIGEHMEIAGESTRRLAEEHLGGIEAEVRVRQGTPADQILGEARDCGADCIVIATRGHGMLEKMLLGSTTERVLRRSPIPVLVVPAHGTPDH